MLLILFFFISPYFSSFFILKSLLYYSIDSTVTAFSTERDEKLPFSVVQGHQVHGDKIAVVTSPVTTREELEGYDAFMTDVEECAIGVRTADCIPVLLYDPIHRVACAVHAGWRGTVAGITAKAVRKMTTVYGTTAVNLRAVIGPGIGPDSFQVGEEVVEAFHTARFPMDSIYSFRGPHVEGTMEGGHHIDLWEANRWLLMQSGVPDSQIEIAAVCTYLRNDRFYSARREGIRCPRIITAIKIHKAR